MLKEYALVAAAAALAMCTPGVAFAQLQPAANTQPSLVMSQVYTTEGVYPTHDSSGAASGGTLGFVYSFAGNFGVGGLPLAQGQVQSIPSNVAAFSILGNTYGGNGTTNFALPNLTGRAIVGASSGNLGSVSGLTTITFNDAQTPGVNPSTAPFDNRQPALGLTPLIAVLGNYPSSGSSLSAFIGQVANFSGNFAPGGWMVADGSLLPIDENYELYSVIGTTYGGNGISTFALPNLIGRVAVGASNLNPLGTAFGENQTVLTAANLLGTPVNNDQASLSLNFLIALQGLYPDRSDGAFDTDYATIGQVVEFAGNSAPEGWAFANGQLLPIAQNAALFSILGTTYGGNGTTNFALPDLRGRTIVGSGPGFVTGARFGTDTFTLAGTVAATPAVPEPATWAMMLLGFAGIGLKFRRRRATGSVLRQVA